MPLLIILVSFIPYMLIGLTFFVINNFLSKRRFLKKFDPNLTSSERHVAWDRSKYIYGEEWPTFLIIAVWPMLLLAIVANNLNWFFKNRNKSSYEKTVDQYYDKYPEEKL